MILKRIALMVIICNHISWSCFGRYTLRQKLNNNYNHCRWSLFYEQLPSAQWKPIPSSIKRIFLFFLLKDNCFTEFCCFLSNLNMNQSGTLLTSDEVWVCEFYADCLQVMRTDALPRALACSGLWGRAVETLRARAFRFLAWVACLRCIWWHSCAVFILTADWLSCWAELLCVYLS